MFDRLAPWFAAIGALLGGFVSLAVFPGRTIPESLYPALPFYSAALIYVLLGAAPPAAAAWLGCSCSHPLREAIRIRTWAALGAYLGALILVVPIVLVLSWLVLSPLITYIFVVRSHAKLSPEPAAATWIAPVSAPARFWLEVYLISFFVLGCLVGGQAVIEGRRLEFYVIIAILVFVAFYGAGAFFLIRILDATIGVRRKTDLTTALALHTAPLLVLIVATASSLPQVLRLDFVIGDAYTGTSVTDYLLAAHAPLAAIVIGSVLLFLRSLRGSSTNVAVNQQE